MNVHKTNLKKILLFQLFLMLFVASGTPLQSSHNQQISIILLAISAVFWLLYGKKTVRKKWVLCFTLLIISLMLTMTANFDPDFSHYIGIIITVMSAGFIISSISSEEFERVFIRFITIISIYSIIITIYSNIRISFPGTLPIFVGGRNSWHHIGIFYYYWGWSPFSKLVRNAACFREPGVWGCYCSLALMFKIKSLGKDNANDDNSKKGNVKIRDVVMLMILTMGVLSSLSTTAIIALGLCIALYLCKDGKLSTRQFYVAILFIIIGGFVLQTQADTLFSKFNEASSSYVSLTERIEGIGAGFSCIVRNPILGSGYTYYINRIVGTSANSFIDVWGKYGIIFLGVIIIGILQKVKTYNLNRFSSLILYLFFVVILGTQNLLIYPVFLTLSLYCYVENTNEGH